MVIASYLREQKYSQGTEWFYKFLIVAFSPFSFLFHPSLSCGIPKVSLNLYFEQFL
jgi:hypothetical protein